MSTISVKGAKTAIADFLDQRVMPAIPGDSSMMKWLFGGVSAVMLKQMDGIVEQYAPMLKSVGVLDEHGNIDIDAVEDFLKCAFDKQAEVRVPMSGMPIVFDKADGEVLIKLLKRNA